MLEEDPKAEEQAQRSMAIHNEGGKFRGTLARWLLLLVLH